MNMHSKPSILFNHPVVLLSLFALLTLFLGEARAQTRPDIADTVVLGTHSVHLKQSSDVLSGHVVANEVRTEGPTEGCSPRELCVGTSVTTPAGFEIWGDSIQIKLGSVVDGDAFYNDLTDNSTGVINGIETTPVNNPPFPVFDVLPAFQTGTPGLQDITVLKNESTTLAPGAYGVLTVKQNGTVTFTGGEYDFAEIDAGTSVQLLFQDASVIRVAGKFSADQNSFIGSEATFLAGEPFQQAAPFASDIIFYVAGINGSTGNLGATPKAAKVGTSADSFANFYVPNGTLHLRQNTNATGAFIAKDVNVGTGVQVRLDSAFGNRAPVAVTDLFQVDQGGTLVGTSVLANDFDLNPADTITLTLPEVTRPLNGTLTLNANGTFTYIHDGGSSTGDMFEYEICDDGNPILCDIGTVDITINDVNEAPIADPQTVLTDGDINLLITLTGTDPEGVLLMFSIESLPLNGVLFDGAEITAVPHTLSGNSVTYDPNTGDNLDDGFTFGASDGLLTGTANIVLNPAPDPPPPDPVGNSTVDVLDVSTETIENTLVTVKLRGEAPCDLFETDPISGLPNGPCLEGVGLTFATGAGCTGTSCAGPANGTLSDLTQGSATVQRTATVDYTPNAGITGLDSFEFEACGTIDATLVCDRATASVETFAAAGLPDLVANNQEVATSEQTSVAITLTVGSGIPDPPVQQQQISLLGSSSDESVDDGSAELTQTVTRAATFSLPAAIAGNVGDANGDGLGDNKDNLPGPAPVLVSAAPNTFATGARRIIMEWDITSLDNETVQNATVSLTTEKGTTDSLDTFFYADDCTTGSGVCSSFSGPSAGLLNGALDLIDYETSATQVPGAVMPVTPGVGMFTFDVTAQLQRAVDRITLDSFGNPAPHYFMIQARVAENSTAGDRGLQIRSTADGNLTTPCTNLTFGPCQPQLNVTTGVNFSILSLPRNGTLLDSTGLALSCSPISDPRNPTTCATPIALPNANLTYTPDAGFSGSDGFQFEASAVARVATGLVNINVFGTLGSCQTDASFCNDGR